MFTSSILLKSKPLSSALMTPRTLRAFGAMDQVNKELFEHKFTNDLEFRSSFEKIKCFRVLDEEGNVINKKYEDSIEEATLKKMYKTMVMMNEADVVYNQAQR